MNDNNTPPFYYCDACKTWHSSSYVCTKFYQLLRLFWRK